MLIGPCLVAKVSCWLCLNALEVSPSTLSFRCWRFETHGATLPENFGDSVCGSKPCKAVEEAVAGIRKSERVVQKSCHEIGATGAEKPEEVGHLVVQVATTWMAV